MESALSGVFFVHGFASAALLPGSHIRYSLYMSSGLVKAVQFLSVFQGVGNGIPITL